MHFIKSIIFAAAAFGLTQAVQPEDERLTQAIYARDALAEALDGDADDFVLYARTIEANKAKRVRDISYVSHLLSLPAAMTY